jgi:hypothetical protein
MIDPDAPTPQNPTSSEIRHFLGGDFYLQEQSSADSELEFEGRVVSRHFKLASRSKGSGNTGALGVTNGRPSIGASVTQSGAAAAAAGTQLTNQTAAVSDYLQPRPPAGSDAHRCVPLTPSFSFILSCLHQTYLIEY